MSAATLLHSLRASGVLVMVEGGALKIDAPAPLSDALLTDLRAHKPQLITLLLADAANDHGAQSGPVAFTPALNPDALADWLRSEALCLVLRDGVLIFTGPNGQGAGEPSAALRQRVEGQRQAVTAWLLPELIDPVKRPEATLRKP